MCTSAVAAVEVQLYLQRPHGGLLEKGREDEALELAQALARNGERVCAARQRLDPQAIRWLQG